MMGVISFAIIEGIADAGVCFLYACLAKFEVHYELYYILN